MAAQLAGQFADAVQQRHQLAVAPVAPAPAAAAASAAVAVAAVAATVAGVPAVPRAQAPILVSGSVVASASPTRQGGRLVAISPDKTAQLVRGNGRKNKAKASKDKKMVNSSGEEADEQEEMSDSELPDGTQPAVGFIPSEAGGAAM